MLGLQLMQREEEAGGTRAYGAHLQPVPTALLGTAQSWQVGHRAVMGDGSPRCPRRVG